METDLDLNELIVKKDHLNVLRYIRVHSLREPELVLYHGRALLGESLTKRSISDDLIRFTIYEQICLAALDCNNSELAEICLSRLKESGMVDTSTSTRFRLLLARCLESAEDYNGAEIIYKACLKENPANSIALKRMYCLIKAQVPVTKSMDECVQALNAYLEQNYSDTSGWYELSKLKQELGDYKGACFCLEEVLLSIPSNAKIHVELAECYATYASSSSSSNEKSDLLLKARKHISQGLELDPTYIRAQIGVVTISNAYLMSIEKTATTNPDDEFEQEVAQELLNYGVEQVIKSCKDNVPMKTLMDEYKNSL